MLQYREDVPAELLKSQKRKQELKKLDRMLSWKATTRSLYVGVSAEGIQERVDSELIGTMIRFPTKRRISSPREGLTALKTESS